jgi:hypothetical protein
MADKSVSIDLIIKSSEVASSLKDVKQSLKDINDAMFEVGENSEQFNKLGEAAKELKDKIDDTNEAIQATGANKFEAVASFAGAASGAITAVSGAMGVLGIDSENAQKSLAAVQSAMAFSQGLQQLSELPKAFVALKGALGLTSVAQQTKNIVDAESVVVTEGQVVATKQLEVAQKSQGLASKIAAGFQYALNLAMSLNPIGLIIAGVAILVGVLFALKDKFKPIQLYFDLIADGVKLIIQGIKDAMDWLGLSSFAENEANEKKLKNIKKIKDAQAEASDHEIRMAKAAGKDVDALEQKKRKDIIDSNKLAMAELLRHAVATSNYTAEQKKQYQELADENKKMNEDIEEANIKHDTKLKEDAAKKKAEDDKKIADDLQKQKDAAKARYEARVSETNNLISVSKKSDEEEQLRLEKSELKKLEIIEKRAEAELTSQYNKSTKSIEATNAYNNAIKNLQEKLESDKDLIAQRFIDLSKKADDDAELRLAETEQAKLKIIYDRQQAQLKSEGEANQESVEITASIQNLLTKNQEKYLADKEKLDKADREKKFADLLTDQEKIISDSASSLDLKLDALNIENEAIKSNQDLNDEQRINKLQENIDREVAITKKANLDKLNSGLDLAKQGLASIQALTDVAFEAKLKKVKKGSEEEEKLMRQQFALNKKMQLAGAIVDGAKAVLSSLAMAPIAIGVVPNPVGIASLAFTVAASLANVAKIASTQFDTTSVSGGVGGGGGGGGTDLNTGAATATSNSQPSTLLNPDGTVANQNTPTPAPIQVYVVESDITSTQTQVAVVQNQMNFQ